jgi:putative ABC transport system permease protein
LASAWPWAQSRDVLGLVMRQSMLLVMTGTAIGLLAPFALTRLLSSLLFGVSATVLPTFVAVPLVLIAVCLIATLLPARRAVKVEPMIALR